MAVEKASQRSQAFFDRSLVCQHPAIQSLVFRAVEAAEKRIAERATRKRREKDRLTYQGLARALVANAAHAIALQLDPPSVAIQLARPTGVRTRYDSAGLRPLKQVLEALSPGLVTVTPSRKKGVASMMLPGDELRECIAALPDFGPQWFKRIGGETIVVRHVERDQRTHAKLSESVDYEDDAATVELRAEVDRINAAIEAADIGFAGDSTAVDLTRKRLRRIFRADTESADFESNGRLSGGWWQNLERERRGGIRIDGQAVADLDFSAMFLRLTYVRAGLEPPAGDLYGGIVGSPQEARWREGVKRFVNAMLARAKPLTRLPKGSKELLPPGLSAAELREAVLRRHGPIADLFEQGLTVSLMRAESDILVAILLRLIGEGIVALPMHDGLMVRQDLAARAGEVMREVCLERTGYAFPVKVKVLGGGSETTGG